MPLEPAETRPRVESSFPRYNQLAINIVSSVFSLADCTLEKQLSTQENWISLGLVSAGSNGIAP